MRIRSRCIIVFLLPCTFIDALSVNGTSSQDKWRHRAPAAPSVQRPFAGEALGLITYGSNTESTNQARVYAVKRIEATAKERIGRQADFPRPVEHVIIERKDLDELLEKETQNFDPFVEALNRYLLTTGSPTRGLVVIDPFFNITQDLEFGRITSWASRCTLRPPLRELFRGAKFIIGYDNVQVAQMRGTNLSKALVVALGANETTTEAPELISNVRGIIFDRPDRRSGRQKSADEYFQAIHEAENRELESRRRPEAPEELRVEGRLVWTRETVMARLSELEAIIDDIEDPLRPALFPLFHLHRNSAPIAEAVGNIGDKLLSANPFWSQFQHRFIAFLVRVELTYPYVAQPMFGEPSPNGRWEVWKPAHLSREWLRKSMPLPRPLRSTAVQTALSRMLTTWDDHVLNRFERGQPVVIRRIFHSLQQLVQLQQLIGDWEYSVSVIHPQNDLPFLILSKDDRNAASPPGRSIARANLHTHGFQTPLWPSPGDIFTALHDDWVNGAESHILAFSREGHVHHAVYDPSQRVFRCASDPRQIEEKLRASGFLIPAPPYERETLGVARFANPHKTEKLDDLNILRRAS